MKGYPARVAQLTPSAKDRFRVDWPDDSRDRRGAPAAEQAITTSRTTKPALRAIPMANALPKLAGAWTWL